MQKDLEKWKTGDYDEERNIIIKVHGGLGDEVCAEPVIRYLLETAYPTARIHIATWYPRLFMHLPAPVYKINGFKAQEDTPYYEMNSLAPHGDLSWLHFSPNLMHITDYTSLMCLKGVIPDERKDIQLEVTEEDEAELTSVVGKIWKQSVVVHPGRGWPSKTFPKEYWNKIIGRLKDKVQVIIIGKHISNEQGTVDIDIPEGVVDTRNLLSLGGILALLRKASILLSNDSAPVHLAGAFDNWILLIPTCKNPSHVLPYRKGSRNYKTKSLYKKLLSNTIDSNPTQVHGQTIDYVVGDIMDYLPDPESVEEEIDQILAD
jgi:hypothetical protein